MNISLTPAESPFDCNCNPALAADLGSILDARAPVWLDMDGSVAGTENVERLDWRDLGGQLCYMATRGTMKRAKAHLEALDAGDSRHKHRLTLLGSGDYHHLSALLVGRFSRPLSLILFDQHPDWDITSPWACCGCWLPRVLEMSHVKRVVVIGAGSEDLKGHHLWRGATKWLKSGRLEIYPATFPSSKIPSTVSTRANRNLRCGRIQDGRIAWKTVQEQGMTALIASVLAGLPTDEVYISVDKDCLQPDYATSNWGAGELDLKSVCAAIEAIGAAKRIVGADITGEWSGGAPRNRWFRAISRFDHPARIAPSRDALEINATTNTALQKALVQAGAY